MSTLKIKDGDGIDKELGAIGTGTSLDPIYNIPALTLLEIAKGNVVGHSEVNKFGGNDDIPADTTEDVWMGQGTYPFPTTTDMTHIKQIADDITMRGATIEVDGLDANWDEVIQNVVLDAANTTTLVALATPLIRVERMRVLANVVAAQDVRLVNSLDTILYGIIIAGHNQTMHSIYTVPAGKTAYLTKYYCTVVEATGKEPKSTRFGIWVADRANNYEFQLKHFVGIPKAGSMIEHAFIPYAGKATEKSDIKITANPIAENGDVAAGFDLILVDN